MNILVSHQAAPPTFCNKMYTQFCSFEITHRIVLCWSCKMFCYIELIVVHRHVVVIWPKSWTCIERLHYAHAAKVVGCGNDLWKISCDINKPCVNDHALNFHVTRCTTCGFVIAAWYVLWMIVCCCLIGYFLFLFFL